MHTVELNRICTLTRSSAEFSVLLFRLLARLPPPYLSHSLHSYSRFLCLLHAIDAFGELVGSLSFSLPFLVVHVHTDKMYIKVSVPWHIRVSPYTLCCSYNMFSALVLSSFPPSLAGYGTAHIVPTKSDNKTVLNGSLLALHLCRSLAFFSPSIQRESICMVCLYAFGMLGCMRESVRASVCMCVCAYVCNASV